MQRDSRLGILDCSADSAHPVGVLEGFHSRQAVALWHKDIRERDVPVLDDAQANLVVHLHGLVARRALADDEPAAT